MSARVDVLLWAQRVLAMTGAPPHQLLGLKADATLEAAQEAFHKIARTSHPDIHRSGLTPEDLETVTLAYARCAGAYQEYRSKRIQTTRLQPIKEPLDSGAPARPSGPIGAQPGAGASGQMNGKALIYYRKAEIALRRGDLKGAMLQIKMAIAGDPQSTFLRTALVEIEAELAQNT
ncbi:MAG: hypothetical protein H0T42_02355 [Deltaproteobacteria bacterium]|nr:hypothetical protein [Deltaproteobacteria bacterium]